MTKSLLSLFVLLLVALPAGAWTVDAEHALYSNMKGIYVFDGASGSGSNLVGDGTMVGTVEDANGFTTPITQSFQSWYNSFGSGYSFVLWHDGMTPAAWGGILYIDGSSFLIWQRYSSKAYFKTYHAGVGRNMSDLLTSELADPMMLSLTWSMDQMYAYDGNDLIGSDVVSTPPPTNGTDEVLTVSGNTTVTRLYIFDVQLTPEQLGALEDDPNSIFITDLAPPTDPDPADEATGVATNATLSWAEVADANDYNVYFGRVGRPLTLFDNVDTNSISIPLGAGIEYQWRVDPNDPNTGATTGDVWTFTTAATTDDPDDPDAPEEPEEPEEPTGWQREPQWRKGPPAWQKRETGLEGWRRR